MSAWNCPRRDEQPGLQTGGGGISANRITPHWVRAPTPPLANAPPKTRAKLVLHGECISIIDIHMHETSSEWWCVRGEFEHTLGHSFWQQGTADRQWVQAR